MRKHLQYTDVQANIIRMCATITIYGCSHYTIYLIRMCLVTLYGCRTHFYNIRMCILQYTDLTIYGYAITIYGCRKWLYTDVVHNLRTDMKNVRTDLRQVRIWASPYIVFTVVMDRISARRWTSPGLDDFTTVFFRRDILKLSFETLDLGNRRLPLDRIFDQIWKNF